jgi:hypothetical protein
MEQVSWQLVLQLAILIILTACMLDFVITDAIKEWKK